MIWADIIICQYEGMEGVIWADLLVYYQGGV